MYKISVPVTMRSLAWYGPEALLKEIQKLDAERVVLALGYYQQDPEKRRASLETLARGARFFREQGYEVCAWIWTFIFEANETIPYVQMRGLDGGHYPNNACPLDEDFLAFSYDYIADIARCGVDVIMFDDDFRYGFLGKTPGCLCDLHTAQINKLVGEELTREQLAEKILSGGKNKYRDAWLQCNGDAFRAFARNARSAVDSVDPKIRMGACACMTAWDVDGIDAAELAQILAGGTKPFVRLIGAPYWAYSRSWGFDVQDVVEQERMESAWTRFEGLEIFAEGDAYPRPRIACPAAFLECFDMGIRASGCTDGILKYGVDYTSQPGYEEGYGRMHNRNRPLYEQIDRHFGGKQSTGIRIYEYAQKAADAVLPTLDGVGDRVDHLFFSQAARVLSHNAIPSTYEGSGITGMAFGENARHLPEEALEKGMILDVAAAKILQDRGIDTGLLMFGEKKTLVLEEFDDGKRIPVYGAQSYEIEVASEAEILSRGGDLIRSYRYENAKGQRFLVLNFVTDIVDKKAFVWKQYARGQQIAENVPWLSGKKLPASAVGNPSLYMQCKEDAESLTVGIWNIFPDPVIDPVVMLGECWNRAQWVNTNGRLEADAAYLEEIPPYGFAAFTLYK